MQYSIRNCAYSVDCVWVCDWVYACPELSAIRNSHKTHAKPCNRVQSTISLWQTYIYSKIITTPPTKHPLPKVYYSKTLWDWKPTATRPLLTLLMALCLPNAWPYNYSICTICISINIISWSPIICTTRSRSNNNRSLGWRMPHPSTLGRSRMMFDRICTR